MRFCIEQKYLSSLLAGGVLLSLVVRFYPLPFFFVFDEKIFYTFSQQYLSRTYFLDAHPPFGKIFWALFLKLSLFLSTDIFYGLQFLRLVNVLLGLALLFVFYKISLRLYPSVALFLTALVALETALLLESKLVLLNTLLLFFIFLSFYFFVEFLEKRKERLVYLSFASGALAFSVKFTGLGFLLFWMLFLLREKEYFKPILLAFFLFVFVWFVFWTFKALWLTFECSLVCPDILVRQEKALGFKIVTRDFFTRLPLFWRAFFQIFQALLFNRFFVVSPFSSEWWSLPFGVRPIVYLVLKETKQVLVLFPNIIVWWTSLGGVLFALKRTLTREIQEKEVYLLSVYFVFWLPLFLLGRVVYLYHFFPSLLFGILLCGRVLERISTKEKTLLYILALLNFIFVLPVLVGQSLPLWWEWVNSDPLFAQFPSF